MSVPFYRQKMEVALRVVAEQLMRFEKEIEVLKEQGGFEYEIESIKTQEIPHLLFVRERFNRSLERITV
jgi:hypothetical protein